MSKSNASQSLEYLSYDHRPIADWKKYTKVNLLRSHDQVAKLCVAARPAHILD